jgi:hypothetical protein
VTNEDLRLPHRRGLLDRCVVDAGARGKDVGEPNDWSPGAIAGEDAHGGVLVAKDRRGRLGICPLDAGKARTLMLPDPVETSSRLLTIGYQTITSEGVLTFGGTIVPPKACWRSSASTASSTPRGCTRAPSRFS